VYSERAASARYIDVKIDRHALTRYSTTVEEIQEIINTAVGGVNVMWTVEGRERYPVNLRYPRHVRDSVDKLRDLPIVTESQEEIQLRDVAEVRVIDGPPVIRSEDARLNGRVYVTITDRDLGSYIGAAQQAVQEQVSLPPGYTLTWAGQYEYMQRAGERLAWIVPLTLAIILMLLYLSFRSFTQALMVMAAVPLSLVGGFWLLYILGYNLSVAVGVGFIALAGVAVEIGVVMLVYLNHALQQHQHEAQRSGVSVSVEEVRAAVIDGALLRVRPIMMTVAAIIAGLMPIMLGSGTGSEVMRRIAAPMVGGMVSATVLTLVVIPAVFLLWKQHGIKQ